MQNVGTNDISLHNRIRRQKRQRQTVIVGDFNFRFVRCCFSFFFFALLLTSIVMYWRLSQSEQELVKLRNMAGYLKIEDENLFYAIAIETDEPWTWRWRVFMPAGHKYSWNIELR